MTENCKGTLTINLFGHCLHFGGCMCVVNVWNSVLLYDLHIGEYYLDFFMSVGYSCIVLTRCYT